MTRTSSIFIENKTEISNSSTRIGLAITDSEARLHFCGLEAITEPTSLKLHRMVLDLHPHNHLVHYFAIFGDMAQKSGKIPLGIFMSSYYLVDHSQALLDWARHLSAQSLSVRFRVFQRWDL